MRFPTESSLLTSQDVQKVNLTLRELDFSLKEVYFGALDLELDFRLQHDFHLTTDHIIDLQNWVAKKFAKFLHLSLDQSWGP